MIFPRFVVILTRLLLAMSFLWYNADFFYKLAHIPTVFPILMTYPWSFAHSSWFSRSPSTNRISHRQYFLIRKVSPGYPLNVFYPYINIINSEIFMIDYKYLFVSTRYKINNNHNGTKLIVNYIINDKPNVW